ncbi:helicase-exonuclease AddAB subunit AddA [Fructobacillus sp. M2-14]|uniref:ATP-dependent helicase/nuclease subunit A n=1 Tax=Fructobacillus broussonetiae TaxID=2713173 RepID=A0ABS5R086_9LACO|nr:helicase-exonuclease AddAB subunit AddA [Fructobacillus broussonetiae]MBS9338860.1 helicase-exonuclease AddAB subunit AddA [Fructobacillus broussonetiae]
MPNYTKNQQMAIDHAGHNILVSASAGSGKTTVLIERLIQKIMAGTSVDQFLIVTFTRAAAGEMKERLEKAITSKLQETTDQKMKVYLQEQLALLPTAAVTTIDGFALQLIESYYYEIDLDPAFRLVADNAEVSLFKNRALDALFDELYQEDHPDHQALMSLIENFASVSRDQGLKDIILKLADFDAARPQEDHWLDSLADAKDTSKPLNEQEAYQAFLDGQVRPTIDQALTDLPAALSAVEGEADEKKFQQAATALLERQAYLQNLQSLLDNQAPYEDFAKAIQQDFADKFPTRFNKNKVEEDDDIAQKAEYLEKALTFKANYFAGKDSTLTKLANGFFSLTEEQWQTINARGQRLVQALVKVTKDYLKVLDEQKQDENVLHFSDLVVLARRILQNDDIRELVQSQFAEVMVDEYQDVNRLQEAFLKDMSNGENMYMVGDIKQSIYGFRQAAPQLFAGKYADFAKDENDDERIELADNFRSENNVTEVINQIFTQIMDEELGDVAYQGSAKLIAKADYPETVKPVFNLDLLAMKKQNQNGAATDGDEADDEEEDDRDTREKKLTYLLEKVQQLVADGKVYDQKEKVMRPVRYEDIAILTRSKTVYPDLLRLANEAGIPVQSESVGNYYQAMEVFLVLDVLRVIDNPHQDIPLAAILRSPLFGFKEQALAEIRLADEQHDFYSALRARAEQDEKAANVLEQLDKWRVYARQNDLVGLIWAIYQDTGWLDYVAGLPGGAQRQANLHALYQRASTFQENGQSGLFAFTRYIEEVQAGGAEVGEVAQESSENAVNLMTIHKSKGLEFPIVILPDLDKEFNQMDSRSSFVLQKDAGIGLDYLEPNAQVKVPTLSKYAVKLALKKQAWSEEMRLYYVALTRAKQQLHLIGRIDPAGESQTREQKLYQDTLQADAQFLPEEQRLTAKSYLDWTLQAFARLENADLDKVLLADAKRERAWVGPETDRKGQIQVTVVNEDELTTKQDLMQESAKVAAQQAAQAAGDATAQADQAQEQGQNQTQGDHANDTLDLQAFEQKLNYRYAHLEATKTAAYQSVSEIKQLFEDPDRPHIQDLYLDEDGRARTQEEVAQADQTTQSAQTTQDTNEPTPQDDKLKANMLAQNELPMPSFMSDGKAKPSPTAVGTATHLILQLINFKKDYSEDDLKKLLQKLVETGQIEEEIAPQVNVKQVQEFLQTEFAERIANHPSTLHREATFAMLVPAKQVYEGLDDEQPILIHGIIDGYFVDEAKKTVTVFDYKTDYVPRGKGPRQQEALLKMKHRYRGQLNLYRQALQDEFPGYVLEPAKLVLLSANKIMELD